jgi:hypothetical protein
MLLGITQENDRYYMRWIGYVSDALTCLDVRVNDNSISAHWVHLPRAGGYYDQDNFTMTVWELIKKEYLTALKDEQFMKTVRAKNG